MSISKLAPLGVLVAGLATATGAFAQQAGVYTGTQANGQSISITVGTDTNTGSLAITSFGIGFGGTCKPGGSTFNTGWGWGDNADITGNTIDYLYSFGYYYAAGTFKFTGSTVSGTITSLTPTFLPVSSGAPTKSVFCTSGKQKFSATLSSGTSARAPSRAVNAPVLLRP